MKKNLLYAFVFSVIFLSATTFYIYQPTEQKLPLSPLPNAIISQKMTSSLKSSAPVLENVRQVATAGNSPAIKNETPQKKAMVISATHQQKMTQSNLDVSSPSNQADVVEPTMLEATLATTSFIPNPRKKTPSKKGIVATPRAVAQTKENKPSAPVKELAVYPAVAVLPENNAPLTHLQTETWRKLENDFAEAVGTTVNPATDQTYRQRWISAQERSDLEFKAKFGYQAFNQHTIEAYRQSGGQ